MKTTKLRAFASRASFTTFLCAASYAGAAPVDLSGRGVFHFASASGCPPGGAQASRGECNRIALDLSAMHATLDTAAHTIVLSSGPATASDGVVGDVLLQGSGVTPEGERVPLSLQMLLRRAGREWDTEVYIHAPVGRRFSQVMMDPYRISVREGQSKRVIFTPEQGRRMFTDPSFARRVGRTLVKVRPTDAANPNAADITIALGVGKVVAPVLRAGFVLEDAASHADLHEATTSGTWSIELEALSKHIPLWVVQRELFLFGLEGHPALRSVRIGGLSKHDNLTFGARGGKGYVRFNGQEAAFAGAAVAGRAFLQESFMGLILNWRHHTATQLAGRAPGTVTAAQP